jgi:hypothetical protein
MDWGTHTFWHSEKEYSPQELWLCYIHFISIQPWSPEDYFSIFHNFVSFQLTVLHFCLMFQVSGFGRIFKYFNILSRLGLIVSTIWIGWLDSLTHYTFTQLETTGDTTLSLFYTLYSSPLHTQQCSRSSLAVSWQRIYNSLTVTSSHTVSLLFTA